MNFVVMPETFSPKVLFFIESGGPGGAERVVLSLAEEYQRRGIPLLVATLRRGWFTDQLARRRIEHTLLPSSGKGFDTGLVQAIRTLIEKEEVTVVHSHLLDSNFYASLAIRGLRVNGQKVRHIATEHGDVHHTSKKRFAKVKMFLADRFGTHFTAVSKYTALHLYRHWVRWRSIDVVGNPLSLPRLNFSTERAATRARLGITEERETHWLWVHVANFREVKDQSTLLRGFALALKNSAEKQTLVIVGDGPEKEKLLGLASDLGLQGHVRWVGFSDEVGVYLAAADGFVLSSRSEALPMSVLEAAIYELVLVSSRVGGVPEIVQDRKTGYLFRPGEPEELANVLNHVLSHREEAIACGKQARELVLKNFLLENVIAKFLNLYQGKS